MGWALKTNKSRPRLGEKVKQFLIEKYEDGERSGNKADPIAVAREMKFKRNENGELFFAPEEWKTAQAIKSFFSRYKAKLKQQQLGGSTRNAHTTPPEEIDEEDMEAWEIETPLQEIRDLAYKHLKIPEHPITVENVNVCQLTKARKLNKLKVTQLQQICTGLSLTVNGPRGRKISYIEPLKQLVNDCTCNN